jgi:hypothetical protein
LLFFGGNFCSKNITKEKSILRTQLIISMKSTKQVVENRERVVVKLPKEVAAYFRKEFNRGKRSEFVTSCILRHRQEKEVALIEEDLQSVRSR